VMRGWFTGPMCALVLALGCAGQILVADQPVDTDGDGFDDSIDPTPEGFDGAAGRETPLSAQLHLHGSLSECNATMAYHTAQAETYGVDVLWWSDHDNMLSMTNKMSGFDFDCGDVICDVETPTGVTSAGFYEIEDDLEDSTSEVLDGGPSGEGYAWHIRGRSAAADEWQHVMHSFTAPTIKAHQMPLMAGVTAGLWVNPAQEVHEDWQLRITALLSYSLDEQPNTITLYLGGDDLVAQTTATALFVPIVAPLPPGEWTELQIPLSDMASDHFHERDDLAALAYLVELYSRRGAEAGVELDDLSFEWDRRGDDLWQYQKQVLADRYSGGGVTHFVGQEISHVEDWQHINPFGEADVPLLDYAELGLVPPLDAVDHVHTHGSIAQCNHPFGSAFALEYEGADADDLTESLAQEWIELGAYGCETVEVGYPERVVDLQHHLRFWDLLGLADLRVTGTGVNDHHWATDWLEFSNPFLTWVFLDQPTRQGIADALERGRVFFGDPGPFVGRDPLLDLWCEHGAVMGQVLQTDLPLVIHVETGTVDPGWWLELVVDGEGCERVLLAGDETDTVFELDRGDVRLVRAQLLDAAEQVVLASNPLFLIRPEEALETDDPRGVDPQ
jgi:hypothetical protein